MKLTADEMRELIAMTPEAVQATLKFLLAREEIAEIKRAKERDKKRKQRGQERDIEGTGAGQCLDNCGTMPGQCRDIEGTTAGHIGDIPPSPPPSSSPPITPLLTTPSSPPFSETPNGVSCAFALESEIEKPNGKRESETAKAFDNWNTVATDLGLPIARKLTPDRERKLKVRLQQHGLKGWNEALRNLYQLPFCLGENKSGWKADFEFMLQAKTFTKVLEMAYARSEGDEH